MSEFTVNEQLAVMRLIIAELDHSEDPILRSALKKMQDSFDAHIASKE